LRFPRYTSSSAGALDGDRAQDLTDQMLAAGLPL
jgi:hypothetical protein